MVLVPQGGGLVGESSLLNELNKPMGVSTEAREAGRPGMENLGCVPLLAGVDNQAMKDLDHRPAELTQTPRARLEEGDLHDLLGYQLAQAAIVTDSVFSRMVGKPLALGQVEFTLLKLIKNNAAVTSSRLARALAITMPAITVWMGKLEQRGLVLRVRSATDRRSQHFCLTPAGDALVSEAIELLLTAERQTFGHLSAAELAMLLELVRRVAHKRPT
jgi:DNA-binding MarR family transcriptional regulator